ncbi:MAG: enolase C-terminal domain-like protein [Burkholderiaceae bacterium]
MKIVDVKLHAFTRPAPGTAADFAIKNTGDTLIDLLTKYVAIQVITDEGVVGESFSLGGGLGLAHTLASTVKPFLIGKNPLHREAIWQGMWHYNRFWLTQVSALGVIDVALWDLYGKIVGRPVAEILGIYREKIPTYASSMTKPTIGAFIDEALDCKERGYQGYKIHSIGDPKQDIELYTQMRRALGDDYPLMVDVVSGYDEYEALRVGRVLEDLGYLWYEEPLREYDIHGYKMLADKLDIPIAGVEVNEGSIYTTPEYITTRAVDIVRSCVGFKAGIGQVKKTAALAEAFGLKLEVHTNGNPVLDAANLAVALSIKNTTFFEQLVPERLFNFGVEEPVFIDKEGFAHMPKGPGIGMKIDWDFVKRYTEVVL